MIMVAKKKQPARRRRPIEEWDNFLFEIVKTHPHYSFGNGSKLERTAFAEHFHPKWDAKCISPEKFTGRMTVFTIIGDRTSERDQWEQAVADQCRSGVGTLTFRGQQSEYLGSLPFDALWNVVLTSLAGGFRYIYLHGAAMKHGSARITSMGFYEEFDIEDV